MVKAELAAVMCGAVLAKTTGEQVPIDGGSDRVIHVETPSQTHSRIRVWDGVLESSKPR